MRTIPIPAVVLCVLTPLLALAQTGRRPADNIVALHDPTFLFWMIGAAIALVAFIASNVVFNRRGGPPYFRRRVS
jgi:hypothetical protein